MGNSPERPAGQKTERRRAEHRLDRKQLRRLPERQSPPSGLSPAAPHPGHVTHRPIEIGPRGRDVAPGKPRRVLQEPVSEAGRGARRARGTGGRNRRGRALVAAAPPARRWRGPPSRGLTPGAGLGHRTELPGRMLIDRRGHRWELQRGHVNAGTPNLGAQRCVNPSIPALAAAYALKYAAARFAAMDDTWMIPPHPCRRMCSRAHFVPLM